VGCGAAGFSSEADVEEYFIDERSLIALGAVVFDEKSFDGQQLRRNSTISYKIRLRAEQYEGTYNPSSGSSSSNRDPWGTENMFPRRASVGPRGDSYGGDVPG